MPDVKIQTKNPGVLEIPEDKKFWQLPLSHYEKLVDKKGYTTVIRALTNLEVWNKNDDPEISKKASDIADKLKKKYKKESKIDDCNEIDEALTKEQADLFALQGELSDIEPEYSTLTDIQFKIGDSVYAAQEYNNDFIIMEKESYNDMCFELAHEFANAIGDSFIKFIDIEKLARTMQEDASYIEPAILIIEQLYPDMLITIDRISEILDEITIDGINYLIFIYNF